MQQATTDKDSAISTNQIWKSIKFLIFIGPPCCGKGTISNPLQSRFKLCKHISAGDLIRKHLKSGTQDSVEINNLISKGFCIPSKISFNLILKDLHRYLNSIKEIVIKEDDHNSKQTNIYNDTSKIKEEKLLIIIDGFPRTSENLCYLLHSTMFKINKPIVFEFECSKIICSERRRMRKGSGTRSDDGEDVFDVRLNDNYINQMPVIKRLNETCIHFLVNSEGIADSICADIIEKLKHM